MKRTIRKWMLSIKNELMNPARSAEMKALSVAIGVFIAISPFMGFHFIMAFTTLALYRKLDKVLVVGFTMLNNWWTMVPIYGFGLWLGELITLQNGLDIHMVQWNMLTLSRFLDGKAFVYIGNYLKPMILPFLVGNLVFAVVGGGLSYLLVLYLLKRRQRIRGGDGIVEPCIPSGEHN